MKTSLVEKIKLPMVELFYGHKCNLSCTGCSSFSDLINDNSLDPSIESIFESIENLSNYVVTEKIDLMGGEVFLYWNTVVQIIKKIKYFYPNVTVGICTNGLLLEKYSKQLVEIANQYGPVVVDITDHYSRFQYHKMSTKFHDSVNRFRFQNNLNDLKIIKSKFYSSSKDYFNKDNQNLMITISKSTVFYPCYYTNSDNKVKPFATNDPIGSRKHGCAMPKCHLLINSKLYKCSWFAFLPQFLKIKNQENDPDWEKYLKYKPVDLKNINQEELTQFYKTSSTHIDLCDMCSNQPQDSIDHTISNVLKK